MPCAEAVGNPLRCDPADDNQNDCSLIDAAEETYESAAVVAFTALNAVAGQVAYTTTSIAVWKSAHVKHEYV